MRRDPMKAGALERSAPNNHLVSSLGRVVGRSPAGIDHLWTLRRRAWRETGVVVLRPEEIADPFARQALINAAQALFGARPPATPATDEKEKP
jgi:hypothetical protein